MKTLLYKQLRLVCQPMTLVFCLFGAMLLIPAYPYTVMWFYVMLGLFFSFLNGREQKDVYYSALLPIRKRDTVKANCLFVGLIELLALLIDRQGLSMTNGEIEAFLWEELHSPQYLQTLFYSLRKTLRGIGFEDLLIRTRNHTSIDVSKLHCDLYEFLKGSADAVNSYAGEYMNNYSWAELTNARLYNGTFSDFVLAAQARPRR